MKLNLYPAFEALSLPHEICYNTQLDNNGIYQLLNYSDHRSSASRGNCRFTKGTMNGIILHTHPYGSKAYPSSEDIIYSINSYDIKKSFIVSTIGVWEIIYDGETYINFNKIENIKNKHDNLIARPLYNVGLNRGLDRSRPENVSVKNLNKKIKDYSNKVTKLMEENGIPGLKINFTHIHRIPENKIYDTNDTSIRSSMRSSVNYSLRSPIRKLSKKKKNKNKNKNKNNIKNKNKKKRTKKRKKMRKKRR